MWRVRGGFVQGWLQRRVPRRRERGAVSIVVALMLVPVLLGVSAIAIDGGSLYVGRRQAQNAADAAALALAKACALDEATCVESEPGSGLLPIVEDNIDFGAGELNGAPCIQEGDGSCSSASLPDLPECPYPIPPVANGVQVRTKSKLDLVLAQIWGTDAASPAACASVVWGTPGKSSATVPFTFSACEWQKATGGDPDVPDSGSYPAEPPYPPYPDASFERVIKLNNFDADPCTTWNGHDVPGGFGWLDDGGSGTCEVDTSTGEWKHIKTGEAPPNGCADVLAAMVSDPDNRVIYLPVYDCMADHDPVSPPVDGQDCNPDSANGTNVWYHLAGYAKFYITGYWLPTAKSKSLITGAYPCSSSTKCLSGFFLQGLISEAELADEPDTPDFGLSAVEIVG